MNKKKYLFHFTKWWWGDSYNIVADGGIGLVEIQYDKSMPNVGYIKGLSVFDNYRNRGIAKALMAVCEQHAIDFGKKFLQLSVEKDNEWLKAWYERLGFVVLNEEEHTFLMIKALSSEDMEMLDNGYYSADLSTTFGYADEEGGER